MCWRMFINTPSQDEKDILELNPLLPESMTDAFGGLHGPL